MTTSDNAMTNAGDSLFAVELGTAMARRNLSLNEISTRLTRLGTPLSPAALSYWRSGQRYPDVDRSREIVVNLEEILRLESGRLLDLVGPPRRGGPDKAVDYDELVGKPGAKAAVLHPTRGGRPPVMSMGGDLTVDMGVDRTVVRSVNRLVWRSRSEDVRSVIVLHEADDPTAARVEVTAGYGCTIGTVRRDDATGLTAIELALDRALGMGETAITEHIITGDCSPEVTHYESVAERRVTEGRLWVRFHPDALPTRCETYESSDAGTFRRAFELAGVSAHHVVHQFGPGVFGLRWTW